MTVIQSDPRLLMWYDQPVMRMGRGTVVSWTDAG